jgi:DNA (cytosine-5)-methyltransferase 1
MKELNVLSLFTGIGGADIGLERVGMKVVAMCEIDKNCQKVLKKHWPDVPCFPDIKKLTKTDLIGFNINVIVGGFPCVDISIGGKQEGISAKRSGLWKEYWRLINELKPKYVIIENVENLRKNGLGIVLYDLASIGYDAEWRIVRATDFGLPHQRQRLFIISYPSGQRCDEYIGKERYLQTNKDRQSKEILLEGKRWESESGEICSVLSRGSFKVDEITKTNRRTFVSSVLRVTDGIPEGLDESLRKRRIKQLGNAIIPDIVEKIGLEIIKDMEIRQ